MPRAVVVSAVGGVPDLVEHGATGFLVSPGDVEGLTSRLLWVLRHPDEVDATDPSVQVVRRSRSRLRRAGRRAPS